MYLKYIKLSGFKSFVDPTVVPINAQMNAVVGPNGCGKSNIVDAIRWVGGESSAKQLRGQSLADVIFNGTATRKAVGKASIELVFDNSQGRIGGEYAAYTELAVRRELFREGQSNYYINGTPCRRRDIVDIFLGTGLGPRSYAIIEQGMISQMIEAKPDELRIHIEEAAGISKYRERRRETENRMRHTQENLSRVNDICEELDKQLRHLQRQANAAVKYKEYRAELRQQKAEAKAQQWQTYANELSDKQQLQRQLETQFAELQARLQEAETQLEALRQAQQDAQAEQQTQQNQNYQIGTEIARLEQQIQHVQDQLQSWHDQLRDIDLSSTTLQTQMTREEEEMQTLSQALEEARPMFAELQNEAVAKRDTLTDLEKQRNHWQQEWDEFQSRQAQGERQIEVLRTKQDNLKQRIQQQTQREEKLQHELAHLDLSRIEQDLLPLKESLNAATSQIAARRVSLENINRRITEQRHINNELREQLQEDQMRLQAARGEVASLTALQESALGHRDHPLANWLQQQQLNQQQRLAEQLEVTSGWEMAAEVVLQPVFDSVLVDDVDSYRHALSEVKEGVLTLIAPTLAAAPSTNQRFITLASKIKSNRDLSPWLHGVYVADTLDHALVMLAQLQADESVVTQDGLWLGANWVRLNKKNNQESSVLLRKKSISALNEKIADLITRIDERQGELQQGEQQLQDLEAGRENEHAALQQDQQQAADIQAQISANDAQVKAIVNKKHELEAEIAELHLLISAAQTELAQLDEALSVALAEQQQHSVGRQALLDKREHLQTELQTSQETYRALQERRNELSVQIATQDNQLNLLRQAATQKHDQLRQLQQRREHLQQQLSDNDDPTAEYQQRLQELLEQQARVQDVLRTQAAQLDQLQVDIKGFNQQNHHTKQEIESTRGRLENIQLETQAITIKQQALVEQIDEEGLSLQEVLPTVDMSIPLTARHENIEQLEKRISRLGPINLAAIEEYEEVNQRKTFLDKQREDLLEALNILENAIQKIDRETRQKFRDTYNQINERFQQLFPKVFSGGRAYLELEEGDLLKTGVLVKAQPPGKRNATIHLLSGGEKALTAIALIFSMFELNPAPFCVLDEVDAPLDELNVNRFCQLVKEMSKDVQFIIISHNKVTIQAADALLGITMQEPGVSRLVSVAVEEAVAMAEA